MTSFFLAFCQSVSVSSIRFYRKFCQNNLIITTYSISYSIRIHIITNYKVYNLLLPIKQATIDPSIPYRILNPALHLYSLLNNLRFVRWIQNKVATVFAYRNLTKYIILSKYSQFMTFHTRVSSSSTKSKKFSQKGRNRNNKGIC